MPKVIPAVTVNDVVLQDIVDMWIYKDADGQVVAEFAYEVRQENGVLHHTGDYRVTLGGDTIQQFKSWIDSRILPDINQQEGM